MLRKFELIFLFFILISFQLFSQEHPSFTVKPPELLYDTDLLTWQFHISRRDSLRKRLPDNSVAVLFAAPVRNRSNDVDYQYHQDPNFYYYTGYPQADAVMLIFKEPHSIRGITSNEFIFIKDRNPSKETWTGKIPSKEETTNTSGIQSVLINEEFENADIDFS
ncbi:MAG: aminopeptidase P N-terminal domain-containing protein, partial [Bacteroidia bacterium]